MMLGIGAIRTLTAAIYITPFRAQRDRPLPVRPAFNDVSTMRYGWRMRQPALAFSSSRRL